MSISEILVLFKLFVRQRWRKFEEGSDQKGQQNVKDQEAVAVKRFNSYSVQGIW